MGATRDAVEPAALQGLSNGRYAKLSPGPGMPASEVAAHQSARFHAAMIELVAERGYEDIAVRDLAERAKVSSRAFYERFRGKEDCFLRTHELVVRRTAKRVVAAQAGERDWRERLQLCFRAFLRELEREPQAARLALVDAYHDGPAARGQARKGELLFVKMLAESFGRAPDGLAVPSCAVEAIVAGVAEVARWHVLSGNRCVPARRLTDELLEWVLACRVRAAEPLPALLRPSSSKPAMGEARSGMSDRDLCLAAVEKLALGEGHSQLTVSSIRAAAGVSRQRFTAEFSGAEECLCVARAEHLAPALALAASARRSATAGNRTAAAVLALCNAFAEDPVLARLCFAARCGGSPCLAGEREAGSQAQATLIEALYGRHGKRLGVPLRASAGMIWTMIGTYALSKRPGALLRRTPLLAALA